MDLDAVYMEYPKCWSAHGPFSCSWSRIQINYSIRTKQPIMSDEWKTYMYTGHSVCAVFEQICDYKIEKGFLNFVKYREVLKFKENIPTQKGLNLWLYSSKLFHQVIYDFCDVYCSADCRKVCCIMTMMMIQT